MRVLVALTIVAGLGACERKASFDQDYEQTSSNLTAIANDIEAQLAGQLNAAAPGSAGTMAAPPAGRERAAP